MVLEWIIWSPIVSEWYQIAFIFHKSIHHPTCIVPRPWYLLQGCLSSKSRSDTQYCIAMGTASCRAPEIHEKAKFPSEMLVVQIKLRLTMPTDYAGDNICCWAADAQTDYADSHPDDYLLLLSKSSSFSEQRWTTRIYLRTFRKVMERGMEGICC